MKDDRPSATAALVLQAVLFAAYDPDHGALVSPEARDLSLEMARKVLGHPRLFLFAARNRALRRTLQSVERLLNPGFVLHVAARKALIDRIARRVIASGAKQLIVVGAGYDTLAHRIATEYSDLACFEVDHPSTQAVKRLSIAPGRAPENLHFASADLSVTPLREALAAQPRFDSDRRSVVVIEGVLMYLPVEAVHSFFEELRSLFGAGLACVFTFMDRGPDGDIEFRTAHPLVKAWLQRKAEMFEWGVERSRIAEHLAQLGFPSVNTYGRAELMQVVARTSNRVPSLAEGEVIGVATV